MIPGLAIPLYLIYAGIGVSLGSIATKILKKDIKKYKKYKAKVEPYYEHFPIKKVDYEKRPRYQVYREIGSKVEDFYKKESDCPTNFVYEQE